MAQNIYDKILRDARVKLVEMFNNNFREQGFFGEKWVSTKISKTNKRGRGSILIQSGNMRRSIRSIIRGMAIVFTSNYPYTALHNEGGNYPVNVRAHCRTGKKSGKSYNVRPHIRQLNMPQRQFIGDHPKVQQALADIVNINLQKMSEALADNFNRK